VFILVFFLLSLLVDWLFLLKRASNVNEMFKLLSLIDVSFENDKLCLQLGNLNNLNQIYKLAEKIKQAEAFD